MSLLFYLTIGVLPAISVAYMARIAFLFLFLIKKIKILTVLLLLIIKMGKINRRGFSPFLL